MTPRTIRRACAELAYLAEAAGEERLEPDAVRAERLRQMGRLLEEIEGLSGPLPADDPSGTDPPVGARSPGGMSAQPAGGTDPLPAVAGVGAMGVLGGRAG